MVRSSTEYRENTRSWGLTGKKLLTAEIAEFTRRTPRKTKKCKEGSAKSWFLGTGYSRLGTHADAAV